MTTSIDITKVTALVDYVSVLQLGRALSSMPTIKDADSNFWQHTGPEWDPIKEKFISLANQLLETSNVYRNAQLDNSWVNNYREGEYINPHYHANCLIAGVLYLEADDRCGDLILQDPLAMTHWFNRVDPIKGTGGRAGVHIKPEPGLMIVFPGFLIHSSQPKPIGSVRHVLSTNIIADYAN